MAEALSGGSAAPGCRGDERTPELVPLIRFRLRPTHWRFERGDRGFLPSAMSARGSVLALAQNFGEVNPKTVRLPFRGERNEQGRGRLSEKKPRRNPLDRRGSAAGPTATNVSQCRAGGYLGAGSNPGRRLHSSRASRRRAAVDRRRRCRSRGRSGRRVAHRASS